MYEIARNVDRHCYVHLNEGIRSCDSMPRPFRDHWQRHITECPLSEREKEWIGKYELILYEGGLQICMECRAGMIALNSRARLRWMLSVGRRHARLPHPSCASQQGLILAVVVIPSHHDILNLDVVPFRDVVYRLIALVHHESIIIRRCIRVRRLH